MRESHPHLLPPLKGRRKTGVANAVDTTASEDNILSAGQSPSNRAVRTTRLRPESRSLSLRFCSCLGYSTRPSALELSSPQTSSYPALFVELVKMKAPAFVDSALVT